MVAPTTSVSEPRDLVIFCVAWAREITAARIDPADQMHQLVSSASFHKHNVGLAVYYIAGSSGATRDSRRQPTVPAFVRYLWHKMPTMPYGVPQPRQCNKCGQMYSWKDNKVDDAQIVQVICSAPGCGNVRNIPRPGNLRDISREVDGGRWMTELLE